MKNEARKNKKLEIFSWALLFAIIIIAFFLRIHDIESIPAGIYPDEAVNGTDAISANETGNYRWFYTNNFGREGLFINLQAFSLKIFGNTVLGLKFWSIIFGTLTVLGVFLLTRELFRSYRAGLIASYLTAFSFWAINFSRIGFRAIMLPFILVFSFYFLFRGIRTKNYFNFIVSGLIYGLGFHTYIAYRVSPLILVILLASFMITRKNFLREYWKQIVIFIASVCVAALPLLYDFYSHPEYFQSRSNAISVFSPEVNQGHLIKTLARSFDLSLVKFNFWGDQNWRHNYPPYPILDPIAGIFFLSGLAYLVIKFFHLAFLRFRHKIRDEKFDIYLFLLVWFLVMLAPEFLTAEGLPHALRSIGTLPVVFIIATVPILWLLGKSQKFGHSFKILIAYLLIFTFMFTGIFNTFKYFVFWANKPEQHGAFAENFKNMSLYLNSLPDNINKYVVPNGGGKMMENGLPVSAQPIKFLTYKKAKNLEFLNPESKLKKPMVIVLMNYDQYIVDRVKLFFPTSQAINIDLSPGNGSNFTAIMITR